ncbi:hypothetical protein SBRCBS47491_000316 [Sporothrix bragantina]|uniref:GRIP domain-containing protein n=1 Tax=Sporothrix bragantina TaxID=671064 RepID=A0ABP0AP98_9PEZI
MPFAVQLQPLLSPQNDNAASTGGAKKKNKKKKSAAAKAAAAQATAASPTEATAPAASTDPDTESGADHNNGDVTEEPSKAPAPVKTEEEDDNDTEHAAEAPLPTPEEEAAAAAASDTETATSPTKPSTNGNGHAHKGSKANGLAIPIHTKTETESSKDSDKDSGAVAPANGTSHHSNGDEDETVASTAPSTPTTAASKTTTSPSAMTQDGPEGEALRAELERLQKQVEELTEAQEAQKEEMEQLRTELQESETGREQAENNYDGLLDRVGKIKESLGSRLKRDQEELEEARSHIEELEKENLDLRKASEAVDSAAANQIARLQKELDAAEHEYEHEQQGLLKSFVREKEDLARQIKQLRSELESTILQNGDWEVIALEERKNCEVAGRKAADLEEELEILREQHQRVLTENASQTDTIDGLQRALNDVQEARKHELRELVQDSDVKLKAAEARALAAEQVAEAAKAEAVNIAKELERTAPFEAEVKEKTALVVKFRHEHIALNEGLTKALRYIKHVNPEDSVNKAVITNNLVAFLTLDRSDPKKFEILQILASILDWKDDVREKVGLARPGASASTVRMPASPFGRTPSTPALHAAIFSQPTPTGPNQPSLGELWTSFLKTSVDSGLQDAPLPSDSAVASILANTTTLTGPSAQTSVAPSSQSSRPGSIASQGGTLPP